MLVSADFLGSDRYHEELEQALGRLRAGEARVVPVLVRACDWKHTTLGGLKALPKDGRPVKSWADLDEALADVARGVREVATVVLESRAPPHAGRSGPRRAQARGRCARGAATAGPRSSGVALLAPLGFQLLEGHPPRCAGAREVIAARLGRADHMKMLRSQVEEDASARQALKDIAGVIVERGAPEWRWTAPVMRRLAGEMR